MRSTEAGADEIVSDHACCFDVEPPADQLRHWRGRPAAAFLVRAFVFLAPIALAIAASLVLVRIFPAPEGTGARIVWWLAITLVTVAVVVLSDRLARRLLPLATLLRLSLVFPDQAPSRFRIALRTGTTRQLANRIEQLRADDRNGVVAAGATELLTLVAALNVHDHATRGHSERVRALSDMIAEEMGLPEEDRDRVRWAALLHDIGKLSVPASILNKAGRPTEDEWRIIETHPEEGARLIDGPLAVWLGEWGRAVLEHHERFDGAGYPKGLAGEDISLGGRLVAVADAFDVITSHRSYKRPLSAEEARAEITACAGSHFDPAVVRAFLQISVGRLRRAAGPLTWLAQIPLLGQAVFVTPSVSAAGAVGGAAAVAAGVVISLAPQLGLDGPQKAAADDAPSVAVAPPGAAVVEIGAPVTVLGPGEVLAATPAEAAVAEAAAGPAPVAQPAPVVAATPRVTTSARPPAANSTAGAATRPAAPVVVAPAETAPPAEPVVEVTAEPVLVLPDTPLAPPPAEVVPPAAPESDSQATHREEIREKLIEKHGACMESESPPPGGRHCGHDGDDISPSNRRAGR